MRDRREPWKWPTCIGLALSLMLVLAFSLPRSWLGFLLSGGEVDEVGLGRPQEQWLVLLPPPTLEIFQPEIEPPTDESKQPLPRLHQDPRWWTERWTVAAERDAALFAPMAPAAEDTVRLLLGELGLGVDFMTRARPDSVLAARLFLLQVEDSFRYDELKPYLDQMRRSKTYADILSKAADMYDEHLGQSIQVPDQPTGITQPE